MMPGLAIAIGGDTKPFEAAMKAAVGVATQTAGQIGAKYAATALGIDRAFAASARNVGVSIGKGLLDSVSPAALGVARLAAGLAVLGTAYATITAAIDQANAQIDRFVRLGENAERSNIGVGFFQRFSEAAEDAKLKTEEIEAALRKAGAAVNPEFEKSDTIRDRLADLFESGYLGDRQSKGLADYRNTDSTEGRIRAAVTAMGELEQAGERLAAIDLGQRLFGDDVAERLRTGQLTIDAIAESLDRKRDDLVTQAEVERAQEFKSRLDEAYATIDEFLGVSVSLEASGRAINEIWLLIAEGVAKATVNAQSFYSQLQGIQAEASKGIFTKLFGEKYGALAGVLTNGYIGTATTIATGTGEVVRGNIQAQTEGSRVVYDKPAGPDLPPGQQAREVPLPPRRPLDMYVNPEKYGIGVDPKGGGGSKQSLDQVETFINTVERSTEALKAEVDAIGKSSAERESAINLARLEATARQQGITLTQEQIDKVRDLSKAHAELKEKLEESREAQQAFREIGGDVLKGIASDARNGANAIELLINAVSRLATRLEDKALDQLADLFFGKSGGGSSGLFGSFNPISLLTSGFGGGSPTGGVRLFASGVEGLDVPRYAAGRTMAGLIHGPGTGTSDSILAVTDTGKPIRVANGESIVTARATRERRPIVEALNANRPLPELSRIVNRLSGSTALPSLRLAQIERYARGGIVGGQIAMAERAMRLPAMDQMRADTAAASSASEKMERRQSPVPLNVTVNGARGNQEILAMVAAGVGAGIKQYDEHLDRQIIYKVAEGQKRYA